MASATDYEEEYHTPGGTVREEWLRQVQLCMLYHRRSGSSNSQLSQVSQGC